MVLTTERTVMTYTPVKRIDSSDGQRFVEIEVRDDGRLFRFVESHRWIDPDDDIAYWTASYWSGLYADAVSAERDARLEFSWLRDEN